MTIAPTNNLPTVFHSGPFPSQDTCRYGSRFLDLKDIGDCAQVSKAWSRAMDDYGIWFPMFENEKIPLIEGRILKAKEDFKFMRPITVSKRAAACLGEFVGEVPVMSEKTFKRLKERDVFDPTKYNGETHVVVVEPTHFERDLTPDLYRGFIQKDSVPQNDPLPPPGITIAIPYSAANVMMLGKEAWKHNETVLADTEVDKILKVCDKVSTTVNVYVMRIISPEQTEQLKYRLQKQYLEKKGYEVAPFGPRFYLNMIKLLNEGTCPDKDVSSSTSDIVLEYDSEASERTGVALFDERTVSIGELNHYPDSEFPLIQLWATDAYDAEMRAAAGFPAELAVVKGNSTPAESAVFEESSEESSEETLRGSKRTHDEAFGLDG